MISLGSGAGKQLYKLDDQRIMRGDGVVSRFFCLPILPDFAHAANVDAGCASFPRGILVSDIGSKTGPVRPPGRPAL